MSNPLGLLAGEWCAADAWRRARHQAASDPDPLLHGWQQVGALVVADMIRRWAGAILADDVGLGKTHSAMAVARYLDARAALVAPAAILPQWRALLDARGIHWPMFSTTRLSRGVHSVGPDIEACDLIIVDEGHHFRNPGTRRYAMLARLAVSRRLLFLSATPIQNSANDLLALFRLFLPDTLIEALQAPGEASNDHDASEDLAPLSGLIGSMVVRRTRAELTRECSVTDFSSRSLISYVAEEPDPEVLNALTRAPAAAMGLQGDPEALYRMVLLKRFASSPHAAVATLKRGRNYLLRLQEAVDAGRTLSRIEFRRAFGDHVVNQMRQSVLPFWYADSLSSVEGKDLERRVELLDDVIARVASLGQAHGGIARLLHEEVREHAPVIVFTAYTETARALFELLRQDANCVLWTGSEVRVSRWTRVELDEALDIFRHGHPLLPALPRVLISTAVASEGLNLVEAKTVIHADLCWNPARLDQRTGRADRLGREDELRVVMFEPARSVERELELVHRIARKRGLERQQLSSGESWVSWAHTIRQSEPEDAHRASGVWWLPTPGPPKVVVANHRIWAADLATQELIDPRPLLRVLRDADRPAAWVSEDPGRVARRVRRLLALPTVSQRLDGAQVDVLRRVHLRAQRWDEVGMHENARRLRTDIAPLITVPLPWAAEQERQRRLRESDDDPTIDTLEKDLGALLPPAPQSSPKDIRIVWFGPDAPRMTDSILGDSTTGSSAAKNVSRETSDAHVR